MEPLANTATATATTTPTVVVVVLVVVVVVPSKTVPCMLRTTYKYGDSDLINVKQFESEQTLTVHTEYAH